MRQIDSSALVTLAKVLGLAGSGSAQTLFDDGNLQQCFDVTGLIRRGRTYAGSEGIFTGELANEHGGAGALDGGLNLYTVNPGAGGFPSPLPEGWDCWLIGSTCVHTSGAALVDAELVISYPTAKMAFGTPTTMLHPIRSYQVSTLSTLTIGARSYFRSIGDGMITVRHPIRLPRGGVSVRWKTNASGVATYTAHMVFGVFPAGLGQDVTA